MTTITSEELWEEVDEQQEWLDTLRGRPGTEGLQHEAAESVAGGLTTIHRLAHQSW